MANFSRLGLGTVQFGLNYGVANVNGQLAASEISTILLRAASVGVEVLDTAAAYGESEQILGQCLDASMDFRLITKTIPLRQAAIGTNELRKISEAFEESLFKLRRNQVDTLMVHHAEDLLVQGGDTIFLKLKEWKAAGLIKKIGVSVYDRQQIDQLFELFDFDVVQVPFSVYDQRLLQDGTLARLASAGVEIHARSIFLQGMLLMPSAQLPSHLVRFVDHHERYLAYLKRTGVKPLEAAISFVTHCPEISVALVGVSSARDFDECISAFSYDRTFDLADFAVADTRLIDPRSWTTQV
jgi:aryl-alcohol dehydrogenase-like predicted oxidoreductase